MLGLRPTRLLALLIAPVVLLGSACSDDGDSTPSVSGASSASSAGTSSTAATVSSKPAIHLGMIVNSTYKDVPPTGARAAIGRINEAGGINGRQLELVVCDTEDKAAVAAGCAQKFAADPSIIATVGDVSSFGGDTNPPLEKASVAGVGTVPLTAGDFGANRLFATTSGGLEFLGIASFLYDRVGSRKIGMAVIDDPGAQVLPGLANGILATRGAKLSGSVVVPVANADVSANVASLAKSDAQALALTEDVALRYLQAARQQGFTGPIMLSETTVRPELLKARLSPADLEKVYAISWFDKTSTGYADYLADLKKYQPTVQPGDLSANAWLSVNLFAKVAAGLDEVTREKVLVGLNAVSGFDTKGMTLPLDYTVKGTALGGAAPRLVPSSLEVFADRYEDGAWLPYEQVQQPITVFK